MPAKFNVLSSTATSLRLPARGVARGRTQGAQRYPLTPVRHPPLSILSTTADLPANGQAQWVTLATRSPLCQRVWEWAPVGARKRRTGRPLPGTTLA
jgi:hypothetical protein